MKSAKEMNESYVFAVISGKGGVGKSMSSVNLAAMLNKSGYKVALIDADLALANCATLMNEPVHATVTQWVGGNCTLKQLPQDCDGVTLVTGADEPGGLQYESEIIMDALDQVTLYLKETHDFVIIDTPAGIGEMALWALDAAEAAILVLVDEPAAISDAYRLCKYVYQIDPEYRFGSLINFAESEDTAMSTHQRFNTILNYFLQKETEYFGFIPESASVREAVQQQKPLLQLKTKNPVVHELEFISQNLIAYAAKQVPATKPVLQ